MEVNYNFPHPCFSPENCKSVPRSLEMVSTQGPRKGSLPGPDSLRNPAGQRGEGGMSHLDKRAQAVRQLALWAEAQAASQQAAPSK